jgi:sterol desaturase/sphingolipid hydroxylase (fatty acid hydroxylase superfamily)
MSSEAIMEISSALGIESGAVLLLLVLIIIWSAIWKLMAMWKSARKGSLAWFIVLGLVNTLGILEILYIYVFSEMKREKKVGRTSKLKRKRR